MTTGLADGNGTRWGAVCPSRRRATTIGPHRGGRLAALPRASSAGRRVAGVSGAGAVVFVVYVGVILAANMASAHWSLLRAGTLTVPAGTLGAGVALTVRDFLHAELGIRGVAPAIAAGSGLSWLLASPHLAAASAVAFAASESTDSLIYARLRSHGETLALTGSNVGGLVVDSLLFVPLAFGSMTALPGQLLGKTAATTVTVALVAAARFLRRQVARREAS